MIAIINGDIYPMEGPNIKDGRLLIEGSKILAVGDEDLLIPAEAEVIDAKGRIVTPGFIDAHTHMGIDEEIHSSVGDDCNEMTDPLTPQLRAYDGVNMQDIGFTDASNAGVTTVMIAPGSANVIGGLVAVVKTAGQARILNKEAGLKMAFGENPKRVYGGQKKAPSTRMATMALARQAFYDARSYALKEDEGFNLGKAYITRTMIKQIPVRAHAHRADDILTALSLKEEFGLDMVIEHCTEGHLIIDELLAAKVGVAVGPSLSNRAKVEMAHVSFKTPGILAQAGLQVAIITDHPCTPIQYLPICAGLAMREGMSEMDAFYAVTINAAKLLQIEQRVGSLVPGKDADVVIWENHPFEIKGKAAFVFVDGKKIK